MLQLQGAVEQVQSATQQTQASSWSGNGHRIVQQLMPRRAFQHGQGGANPIKVQPLLPKPAALT